MIGTPRPCSRRAAITGVLVARIRSGGHLRQLGCVAAQEIALAHPAILDPQVVSIQPPQLPQSAFERGDTRLRFRVVGGHRHQRNDPPPPAALLRARYERPTCSGTAEQRDEVAPSHVGHGTFSHAVAPAHA